MIKARKHIFISISILIILCGILIVTNKNTYSKKVINIEQELLEPNYSYLPEVAKKYIKEYYEENGVLLLTEKNKKEDMPYLNPAYIEYLKNGSSGTVIPSPLIVDFNPKSVKKVRANLPSQYDLRNVNGKNFVTPFEDQGDEGLCWDYAINAHMESGLLVKSNESYNSNSIILSKQQLDYATAGATTYGRSAFNRSWCNRKLSDGATYNCVVEGLLDGLATVPNSWDDSHRDAFVHSFNDDNLVPKKNIDAVDIYNFNNSLYELNSEIEFPKLDFNNVSSQVKTDYINEIKNRVVTYGGAWVAVDMLYGYVNTYNGKQTAVLHKMEDSARGISLAHAMEVIGWDDNYEYTYCNDPHNIAGEFDLSECDEDKKVTMRGVWILKNSWPDNGDDWMNTIKLLGYESYDTDFLFITDLASRTWDNYYQMDVKMIDDNTNIYSFKDTNYVETEKLDKIKIHLNQNNNHKIYISLNGDSNYTLIQEMQERYPGYYYADLSSGSYNITDKTTFKVVGTSSLDNYEGDFRVYTDNTSNAIKIKTFDVNYDRSTAFFSGSKDFDFSLYSNVKNLDNGAKLTYKIKDTQGNYMDSASYSYAYNSVYANIADTKLTINSNYFPKGIYTIETYYNNTLYSTAKLTIGIDLMTVSGNGTDANPWQISTPEEFDFIRNMPGDSFVLKNDIDFRDATQSPGGSLYNDGYGFEPIDHFYGYLDGKGHSIKNLYSKSNYDYDTSIETKKGGIFDYVDITTFEEASNYCKLSKCGFSNIKVVNPTIIGTYSTGGFVNNLTISPMADLVTTQVTEKAKFDNISVIGGKVTNLEFPSYEIGGIVGTLSSSENAFYTNLTINNLYNSSNVISSNTRDDIPETIGGILGDYRVWTDGDYSVTFNNVMNTGKITTSSNTMASNLFNVEYHVQSNVSINNAIFIKNNNVKVINSNLSQSELSDLKVNLKNFYTDANTMTPNTMTPTLTNVLKNKSIYEIANADYSGWSNFNNNWYQNKDNDINRIPVIKNISYDYLDMEQEVTLHAGETFDLKDLVSSSNKDISVLTSCDYNLDICSNNTDTNIISVDGTSITALQNGTTTVIVGGKNDGYLGIVNVYVGDFVRVTYNSNDGNNNTYSQSIEKDVESQLNDNKFTRAGYKFVGWNTKADGTGTSYNDKQSVTLSSDIQLYAKWEIIKYNIVFDSNGGTGSMDSISATYNVEYTLPENKFEKEHYFFMNWNTKADGTGTNYIDKAKVKNLTTEDNKTITLYAIWKAADGIINFHANNDSDATKSQEFIFDTDFNLLENSFSNEGFTYVGWNTKADGTGTSYNDKQVMHVNTEGSYKTIDLYAIWDEEYDFIINNYSSDRDDKIIDLIDYGTNMEQYKSNILLNKNYSIEVEYKEINGNKCVYTGGKTKILKNNTDYMEFVNIVRGDVNGSGDIDIIDYIKIRKEILDKEKLNGVYKTAADFNKNNNIDDVDYTKIKNIIMGDKS